MFLDKNKAQQRLSSHRNVIVGMALDKIQSEEGLKTFRPFRQNGDNQIPEMMHNIVGAAANFDSVRKVGAEFGISKTEVQENKVELQKKNIDVLAPARELAVNRMTQALKGISDEKLQDLGAKTLSEVARNVSSVVRNVTEGRKEDDGNKYVLNIFSPTAQRMKLNEREIIDVGVLEVEAEATF